MFRINVSGYEEHLWKFSLENEYGKSYRVVIFTGGQIAKWMTYTVYIAYICVIAEPAHLNQ